MNIMLVAFLVSEPSSEEEPASDAVDEETDLAGENITLHITKTCFFIYKKKCHGHSCIQSATVRQEGLAGMTT